VIRRALAVLSAAAALAGPASAGPPLAPEPEWLLDQVKALSAPAMDGRRSGTPGADLAAQHVARAFAAAGLRPGGDAGMYLQAFEVPIGVRLGAPNALSAAGPPARAFALGADFVPLAVSESGREAAPLLFAGYGITAPDLAYDDYAGVDARGKLVLVVEGEPGRDDPASPFRRPEAYHYSEHRHKIINAREHGARGVLLVAHPSASRDALAPLGGLAQPWGVLAASVTRRAADELLAPAGRPLAALTAAIDAALRPASLPVGSAPVALEVTLEREHGRTANVIGVLPGTDPRRRGEAIVVGAHYDHLGHGGEGSLAPDQAGAVHPGADDNASGTAAVLGLARALAAAGGLPRTVVFAAFTGEEMGLLGSAEYVRRPAVPLGRTILMLNLDMVGRPREGKLYLGGVDSAAELRGLVAHAARGLPLTPELRGDPYGPSDHSVFYAAGVPVLFFFTGAHADYHRPTDTWDKIDAAGLAAVTLLAARLVEAVAAEPAPPVYVKVVAPPAERARGAGGGYGPYFGVLPDFGEGPGPGVKITGVRADSPAEKAGLRGGDVIVELGGVTLRTLNDLSFALRARRPGDQVDVRFMRDGQEHAARARLEERR
jgi:hypothetical protein